MRLTRIDNQRISAMTSNRILILLCILDLGLSGCAFEPDRRTTNLVELISVECLKNEEERDLGDTHLSDMLVRIRNHSEDTVGILTYNSEVQFSIPGVPPSKKPCTCIGTKYGFKILKNSTILDLAPVAEEDFFIIAPRSDKAISFITRSSNVPFSDLSKDEIIDILCTGIIQYESPCDSIDSSYFPKGVKWVSEIKIK